MSHPPVDTLGPRKRKAVPINPLNAEAERLENVAARKKARLALNSGKKVLVAKAKNTGHNETLPAKLSNRAQRQPSIEEVEDADDIRSRQRIPPNNPKNIIESDDDEPDGMAMSSKGSNKNKRNLPSEIDDDIPPPLLETEDDDDDDDEDIEPPTESAEAELRES